MPKQTTHVLEIEKGVGEPTFIPLAEGEELQPISVGKRGQWRLEGPRVLDVHAYIYYDGKALFAQSADDTSPVQVSGQRIGKQWTEVQLPCRLFIGSAILRCRSLLEEDDSATIAQEGGPPVAAPPAAATLQSRDALPDLSGEAIDDNAATMARPSPLDRSKQSVRPAAGVPAGPPKTQLLDARPFAPGAFSTRDDESTRNGPPPEFPKRSAAMNDGLMSTGDSIARRLPGHPGLEAPPLQPGGGPMTIVAEGQPVHLSGAGPALSMEPSVQIADQGPPPMALGAPPGFGAPSAEPPFAGPGAPPPFDPAFAPPQPPAFDPAFGPPGGAPFDPAFAPPPPAAPVEPAKAGEGPPSLERFKAEWRAASPVKKATWFMFPLVLIAGLSLVFDDDEPAPKRRGAKTLPDGGVLHRGDGGAAGPVASNGAVVPPPPSGASVPPTSVAVVAPTGPTPPETSGSQPTPPPPSSTEAPQAGGVAPGATAKEKTLEREAVDALATSNNQRALEIYTELAKQNPQNPAFQQMVRLLTPRAK